MKKEIIFLVVGRSGTGKSTLVDMYCKEHGTTVIQSYTTRPKRYEGETGHIFVDKNSFPCAEDWVAYTMFDGYKYCATQQQIENNDFYIIDQSGIFWLLNKYKGNKKIIIIYLRCSDEEIINRMTKRGDTKENIMKRLEHDKDKFDRMYLLNCINVYVESNDLQKNYKDFVTVIKNYEKIAVNNLIRDGK